MADRCICVTVDDNHRQKPMNQKQNSRFNNSQDGAFITETLKLQILKTMRRNIQKMSWIRPKVNWWRAAMWIPEILE